MDSKQYKSELRKFPKVEDAFFPQSEPMMNIIALREAYDYFIHKLPNADAVIFFDYLQHLEKDIPLDKQKCNIKFFHKVKF
jgi:hypothetical protein